MHERMTGYVLLMVGVLIMFGALIQTLLVFTGKTEPISLFHITAPTISPSSFMPQLPDGFQLPTDNKQNIELIPSADFNKILDMSTMLFLMGFVLSFGFKIASLGVMLLRPISVKLANKTEPPQA